MVGCVFEGCFGFCLCRNFYNEILFNCIFQYLQKLAGSSCAFDPLDKKEWNLYR